MDQIIQLHEIADRAVERLMDRLQSQGASREDLVALEQAVESRSALEVITLPTEELLNSGKSVQQTIFDHLVGPPEEGMGISAVARHLEIGIPE